MRSTLVLCLVAFTHSDKLCDKVSWYFTEIQDKYFLKGKGINVLVNCNLEDLYLLWFYLIRNKKQTSNFSS